MRNRKWFTRFAERSACWAGGAAAFVAALVIVVVWAITGPFFGFSDTWQLVINTGTTIVTFLMVFLIQNTQNRDIRAVHLKLDELIRATRGAHTVLLELEALDDHEIEAIRQKYAAIADKARRRLRAGQTDTNIPEIVIDGDLLKSRPQ
jgi:low affinity Fe/Cu permease